MLQKHGSCNNCGQCCGCETAPNRMSPFPATWPEAVAKWTVESLVEGAPIFQITGHPDIGGPIAGVVRMNNKNWYWLWRLGQPDHGLVANAPPWADDSTYEPQCPFLDSGQAGVYPCGAEGDVLGEVIRNNLGCREIGMPEFLEAEQWIDYLADHPLCSLDYQTV